MNPNELFSQFFDIGKDVLNTFLDKVTNVILAQLGDSTNQVPDADAAEWWQHTGFWSRPAKPTQGKPSCQSIVLKRGDRDIVIATRDTRNSKIYGALDHGETCVGSSVSEARTFYKKDGSIYHITSIGNDPSGTTFAVHQGPDGSYTIQAPNWIFQGDASGKITLGNSGCGITLDPATGTVHIFGTIVNCQASGVAHFTGDKATLIGPNALPSPTNAVAVTPGAPANPVSENVFVSLTGN